MSISNPEQLSLLTQVGPHEQVVVDPDVTTGPNRMRAEIDVQKASTDAVASVALQAEVKVDHSDANARRREANARTPHYPSTSRY